MWRRNVTANDCILSSYCLEVIPPPPPPPQELKQQNALLSESRLLLQEEIGSLQTKFEKLSEFCHI